LSKANIPPQTHIGTFQSQQAITVLLVITILITIKEKTYQNTWKLAFIFTTGNRLTKMSSIAFVH